MISTGEAEVLRETPATVPQVHCQSHTDRPSIEPGA
jgi:hypothetical protein